MKSTPIPASWSMPATARSSTSHALAPVRLRSCSIPGGAIGVLPGRSSSRASRPSPALAATIARAPGSASRGRCHARPSASRPSSIGAQERRHRGTIRPGRLGFRRRQCPRLRRSVPNGCRRPRLGRCGRKRRRYADNRKSDDDGNISYVPTFRKCPMQSRRATSPMGSRRHPGARHECARRDSRAPRYGMVGRSSTRSSWTSPNTR